MGSFFIMSEQDKQFIEKAIELAIEKMEAGKGGPFGAIVVKDGKIIGMGYNQVNSAHDPTAHAEVVAIREACKHLGSHQLTGCELYTSCEPCPMCLGAIYWARPDAVYFAATKEDASKAGFDDQLIYDELLLPLAERKIPMIRMEVKNARAPFEKWLEKPDRVDY